MSSGRGHGKPGQELPPPDGEPTAAAAGPTVSLGEIPHDPEGCNLGGRPHLGPCVAALALACAGVTVYEWVMVLHG